MKGLGLKIKKIFSSNKNSQQSLEELEDMLIESDIGATTAMEIIDQLQYDMGKKISLSANNITDQAILKVKDIIKNYLICDIPDVKKDKFTIFLILGVNGVGKTTNLAKIGNYYKTNENVEVVFSAADTYRAAAIDQLKIHGTKLDIRVVSQEPGADPGAVIYDTIVSARNKNEKLILADTAGRMHNKANLVRELQKIDKIIANKAADAFYKKILVLDATTGQNAIRQAELFHEAVGIDYIFIAKIDSAAKAGMVVPICRDLKIPISFIGNGETYDSIKPFSIEEYIDILIDRG